MPAHLEVKVRPETSAGRARIAEPVPSSEDLSAPDRDLGQVGVQRHPTPRVTKLDEAPPTLGLDPGAAHSTVGDGFYEGVLGRAEVQTSVPARPSPQRPRSEAAGDHRAAAAQGEVPARLRFGGGTLGPDGGLVALTRTQGQCERGGERTDGQAPLEAAPGFGFVDGGRAAHVRSDDERRRPIGPSPVHGRKGRLTRSNRLERGECGALRAEEGKLGIPRTRDAEGAHLPVNILKTQSMPPCWR